MNADLFAGSGATLSPCRKYRYRLWRSWGPREHRCVWVMVNPSTADENVDDTTIRKCIGFAKRWGFGAIDVVNLFAYRSTDVTELLRVDDPIGPDNLDALKAALSDAHRVVLAWGKHNVRVSRLVRERAEHLGFDHLHRGPGVEGTLGHNGDGSPETPSHAAVLDEVPAGAGVPMNHTSQKSWLIMRAGTLLLDQKYLTRQSAALEAADLAKEHIGQNFLVLEAVCSFCDGGTHRTDFS